MPPRVCRTIGEDYDFTYSEDCERCPSLNQGCPIYQLIRRVKRLEEELNMIEEGAP